MISMSSLLLNYHRLQNTPWVRFGITTGFILSLAYTALAIISFDLLSDQTSIFMITIFFVLPLLLALLVTKVFTFIKQLLHSEIGKVLFLVIASIFGYLIWSNRGLREIVISFAFIFVLSPGATLGFAFLAYKQLGFPIPSLKFVLPYLSAYSIALGFAIQKTIHEYSLLPKSPPDCFIATAAAKGHPTITKSWSITPNFRATRQLQTFKLCEFVLRHTSPTVWRVLRKFYNRTGYGLAKHISTPLISDLVYISLLPLEFTISILLKLLLPNSTILRDQLFVQ